MLAHVWTMPDVETIRWLVLTVCVARSLVWNDLRERTPTSDGFPYGVNVGVLSRPARAAAARLRQS
jgi:hypothetical protein